MWRTRAIFYLIFVVSPSTSDLYSFDCDCNRPADLNVSETKLDFINFQTNKNSTYYVSEAAEKFLNSSDFDPTQCVHMFVPGLQTTNTSLMTKVATCSLSQTTCDDGKRPLVIVVDHSAYLNGYFVQKLNFIEFYKNAVRPVKSIGIHIAMFVIELLKVIDRNLLRILGHSLGAHMCGYMGNYIKQQTGTPLNTLFAADPAGPCYENCPNEHIKSGDAVSVITMHTNAGQLGTTANMTDCEFYANDGQKQEECYFNSPIQVANPIQNFCSHNLAVPFSYTPFVLKSGWRAVKCSSAEAFLSHQCDGNESVDVRYGNQPNGCSGIYFFQPGQSLVCLDGIFEVYYYLGLSFFSKELSIFS